MAKFCTKCGTSLEENLNFCPKCGAAVGAATAPSALPAPAPARGAVTGGASTAAPAAKGNPFLKIILLVVSIFAFVTVLGIGSCIYFAYRVKQKATAMVEGAKSARQSLGTPEVHLEKGGAGSQAATTATIDVPPYPGSVPTKSEGELSFGKSGAVSGQEYETADSVEKVLAFYKDKFGSKITIQESEGNAEFTLLTKTAVNTVTITRDEDASKTTINIARMGK